MIIDTANREISTKTSGVLVENTRQENEEVEKVNLDSKGQKFISE